MESASALLPHELVHRVPGLDVAEARRVVSLVHRLGELPAVTPAGVRRAPYQALRRLVSTPHLTLVEERPSAIDPFVKYAFAAPDGAIVEAVRIPLERPGRFVACVSCQVGCGMGCAFCGTARLGHRRQLASWEIIDQVRQLRGRLPAGSRIHGVVFQGMGEPLANLAAVLTTIRVLCEPAALAIDACNVTVSTAGLVPGLAELLSSIPRRVRIALSIGSAIPARRLALIPSERQHPLAGLLALLAAHARRTRVAPVLSYTLLGGVNDTDEDIAALTALIDGFLAAAGLQPRLSLITYNRLGVDDPFVPAPPERLDAFRERIGGRGTPVVRRYSGGGDVEAACGQLGLSLARG
ncbi:MAG: radical SAM protein [Polyangiaceae bacterium]|nr:radical SAM protein [Polyangiaceae bacterium]